MNAKNKYILVHLLDNQEPGTQFESWPPHVTLLSWFSVSGPERVEETARLLNGVAKQHHPVTSLAVAEDLFGVARDIPATRLELTQALRNLHRDLFATVVGNGLELHNSVFMNDNYKPHVTHTAKNKLPVGAEVVIDQFSLISAPSDKHQPSVKTVLANMVLGNGPTE